MLKRLSSLFMLLVLVGSVLAATGQVRNEHVCEMAGMELMPGMETMPCCEEEQPDVTAAEPGTMGMCCVTIPRAPGLSGTTYKLHPPSFSVAVVPALVESAGPGKRYQSSYSTKVYLPNLQASYIRNLSFLI